MSGTLKESWTFVWQDVWLPFEGSGAWTRESEQREYTVDEFYMELYVALTKALKKAPQPEVFNATATDPAMARTFVKTLEPGQLRSESAIAQFFEDAYDVVSEGGNSDLEEEFQGLVSRFLRSRNLRYHVIAPFKLYSHVPGVFAALFTDLVETARNSDQLNDALVDFQSAFQSLASSHSEGDAKTCILKATMLVEAIASAVPGAEGGTLGKLCNSLQCWPHTALKDAVKSIYGFCSDYPGIRHNANSRGRLRALETRDSIIVPLLLFAAAGYFAPNSNLLDTLRNRSEDPKQEPPDPPVIDGQQQLA